MDGGGSTEPDARDQLVSGSGGCRNVAALVSASGSCARTGFPPTRDTPGVTNKSSRQQHHRHRHPPSSFLFLLLPPPSSSFSFLLLPVMGRKKGASSSAAARKRRSADTRGYSTTSSVVPSANPAETAAEKTAAEAAAEKTAAEAVVVNHHYYSNCSRREPDRCIDPISLPELVSSLRASWWAAKTAAAAAATTTTAAATTTTLATSWSGSPPCTNYRFAKRLGNIYDRLIDAGFTVSQMQSVVQAHGHDLTLDLALYDLCRTVPPAELPLLFREVPRPSDETSGVGAGGVEYLLQSFPQTSSSPPEEEKEQQQQRHVLRKDTVWPPEQQQQPPPPPPQQWQRIDKDEKQIILQHYQYVSDDDEEEEEEEREREPEKEEEKSTQAEETLHAKQQQQQQPTTTKTSLHPPIHPSEPSSTTTTTAPATALTLLQREWQQAQHHWQQAQADWNDPVANYMRSKYEIKELHNTVHFWYVKVQVLQAKVKREQALAAKSHGNDNRKENDDDDKDDKHNDENDDESLEVDLACLFDENHDQCHTQSSPPAPAPIQPNHNTIPPRPEPESLSSSSSSSSSSLLFIPVIPKQWTGKTPKEVLEDTCRKQEMPQPIYRKIGRNGCHLTVVRRTPNQPSSRSRSRSSKPDQHQTIDVEQTALDRATSYGDAQHYVATVALFQMNPHLPLHWVLPPFYRDVWKQWMEERQESKQSSEDERRNIIQSLIDLIPPPPQKNRKPASLETKVIVEEEEEEEEEPNDNFPEDWEKVELPTSSAQIKSVFVKPIQQDIRARQASPAYQAMARERAQLPVFDVRDEILQAVRRHAVTVISAETGAGKSTQIPQFILEEALLAGRRDTFILCTQPRRVAAISLAERVSDEMAEETVGRLVGYQIRLETRKCRNTRLLFCTTGVVLSRLVDDPELSGVTHVVVDEVHERQWQIDVLLVALRSLLNGRRPDLKVILVSEFATTCNIFFFLARQR